MKYDLFMTDLDGTLLNGRKEITPAVEAAVNELIDAGKVFAVGTGRCRGELKPIVEALPRLRYVSACCGAHIYDAQTGENIHSESMELDKVLELVRRSIDQDPFIELMTSVSVITNRGFKYVADYGMDCYRQIFVDTALFVDDIEAYILTEKPEVYTVNIYFRTAEQCALVRKRTADLGFVDTDNEFHGVQYTMPQVSKGTGLEKLCEKLSIPVERSVAIGDAMNDMTMVMRAGLGIAMGNADERLKKAAGAVVADNEHDGEAEAIRRFML